MIRNGALRRDPNGALIRRAAPSYGFEMPLPYNVSGDDPAMFWEVVPSKNQKAFQTVNTCSHTEIMFDAQQGRTGQYFDFDSIDLEGRTTV